MNPFLVDIETRPDPVIQTSEEWWARAAARIEPDLRIKDPVKQAERTTSKLDDQKARMALSPLTGLIACIGYQGWSDHEKTVLCVEACTREAEAKMLREFADAMPPEAGLLVTWNGKRFDVPFVITRCMVHGITLPWWPKPRDYRHSVDLMDDLGLAFESMSELRFVLGGSFKEVEGEALLDLPLSELAVHCGEDLEDLMTIATRTQAVWMPRGSS